MPRNKFFYTCYGIILILLIIWLMTKISFIFTPFIIAFQTLFIPFLLSGVLFYLFKPLIDLLDGKGIPRALAILLLYLVLIGVLVGLSLLVGPILQRQLDLLIQNIPSIAESLRQEWERFELNRTEFPDYVEGMIDNTIAAAQSVIASIGRNFYNMLGVVANVVIVAVIVPFILFYMLKDGHRVPHQMFKFLPQDQIKEGKTILYDMNRALSTYVQGLVIVSLCVGMMVYIGYLIIGIDYSLILAIVAMLTNVIPFVGPFIGIIPALIVGFLDSPAMVIKVIIVVVVAQQIESNLISPQVMSRALDIHPLTIILLLLVASALGGVLALILAVPTYAIIKVIVKHAYRLIRLRLDLRH